MLQLAMKKIDVRWLLGGFGLLLVAGIWTLTLLQLDKARQSELLDARRDASGLARLFDEHATRTIEAADQAVIFLRHRYASLGTGLDINSELKNGLGPGDIYNLFTIVDARGDVVLSSKPFQPINLADREHVKVHMQGRVDDSQLFISKPVLGRVSKKWSLQMTRRIGAPGAPFGGAVIVSMDPQYFLRLYDDINVGRHGAIALIGTDAVVRVRRLGREDAIGEDVGNSALFGQMLRGASGIITGRGLLDGRERIYAYEKLQRFPLYVVVGLDEDERLAAFADGRRQALTLASVMTLLIVIASAALIVLVGWLIRSRERALGASLAKSRFLSNMSHELRTPLNGILGYSELLAEELGESTQGGFARAVHGCGMRLLGLIEAVLELSALESGKTRLELREEALPALLAQACNNHLPAAREKGLELQQALSSQLPATICCDRAKLLRVLDILLGNAVSVSAAGAVQLAVTTSGEGLLLQVRDHGQGVPPEQRRQIFEKFAMADDSPSRAKDSAGLGLAIAAQLVEVMGGQIWVEAAPGAGAIFSFSLPLPDAVPHSAGPAVERL